jgi:putative membrane-bound dehydrogenase-like protein
MVRFDLLVRSALVMFLSLVLLAPAAIRAQEEPPAPVPPAEAPGRMTLPPSFQATLFAGEPDVVQPIAIAFDDRGRLWVAECLSYPTWKEKGNDRIVVFEDKDNDGEFDSRRVFWDQGNYLTGLAVGFGGVWACCAPHLLFIPDRNGDDTPDGPPEVVLDGWSTQGVHNVVNGLIWGPDGWLYGCNGITSPSKVGTPSTPPEKRQDIACGIWRYHPVRKTFEAAAHGTTNPWGLDFDQYGHGFFTNCVISHMFHYMPGAHYQRMFGQDYDPYVYELMESCSDHLHWGGGNWTDAHAGRDGNSVEGGGHAHAGAMVYLGDNWPDKYRNNIFMHNIHGRRLNQDRLVRRQSGYTGKHGEDFLFANDPWFRGVALAYGPDGGVFLTDWCDIGECHDNKEDAIERANGRIHKIVYGEAPTLEPFDLAKLDDAALVKLIAHKNEWYVRRARRLLQERAARDGGASAEVIAQLQQMFEQEPETPGKLRALFTLHAIDALPEEKLLPLLTHQDEYLRAWAVRLLTDYRDASPEALASLAEAAARDEAGLVRLELAASLQRVPDDALRRIAAGLVTHAEDAEDSNLQLMIWYGVEPLAQNTVQATRLLAQCKLPIVRRHLARRIAAQ